MTQAYKLNPFSEPLAVPKELMKRKQWIGWKAVWTTRDRTTGAVKHLDKPKKIPINIKTGMADGYELAENQVSYDEALAALGRLKLSGVGFMLMPGCGLIGGDIDKCRDPATGAIEPWAQQIIDLRETYFEVSPSGEGIRFWALIGDLPVTLKKDNAGVELYSQGRYLTFTGDHIAGTPWEIGRAPEAIRALMKRAAAFKPSGPASGPGSGSGSNPNAPPDFKTWADRETYRRSPMGQINQAALKNIPAWAPEVFPQGELQATGAWRVKAADLNRPFEEDISIHPDGVQDWAEREGKTAIDIVIEWLDVTPRLDATEAAEWLAGKLNIPFDPGSGSSPDPDPGVSAKPLTTFNPTIFAGKGSAPPLEWLVQDWVPCGVVTGVYGDGGTGKSLLMMQLQTSTALGKPWLGLAVQQVKSLGIYCEDEHNELWRRQEKINASMFCDMKDLADAEMSSRIGEENWLMAFGRSGRGELTKFYHEVEERALDLGSRLVVIDGVADTFGGNEIVRSEVRQFVQRALGGLALKIGGAVVACAHPSQAGLNSGSGVLGIDRLVERLQIAGLSRTRPGERGRAAIQADESELCASQRGNGSALESRGVYADGARSGCRRFGGFRRGGRRSPVPRRVR